MVRLRMVIDCFIEGWEFLKASGKITFTKLLKITTLSYLVVVLFLLITLITFSILHGQADWSGANTNTIMSLLFSIVVILLGIFFSSVVSSVSFNVIDGMFQKKEVSVKTKFIDNLIPMLKWSVFHIALFSPYIILFYLLLISIINSPDHESDPLSTLFKLNLLPTLIRSTMDLVSAVINFFIIFGIYELIIARKGLFSSVLRSINLVKNNFIETLAFVIIKEAINSLLVIPLAILFIIGLFVFIPLITAMVHASLIPSEALSIAIVGVLLFLFISLILFSALSATIFIPVEYIYWKKIQEKNTS